MDLPSSVLLLEPYRIPLQSCLSRLRDSIKGVVERSRADRQCLWEVCRVSTSYRLPVVFRQYRDGCYCADKRSVWVVKLDRQPIVTIGSHRCNRRRNIWPVNWAREIVQIALVILYHIVSEYYVLYRQLATLFPCFGIVRVTEISVVNDLKIPSQTIVRNVP